MSRIIEIEKINKSFGKNSVLRDLSFSVDEGEFLCLIGKSGCGKSTLLRLLLNLEKQDNGMIKYDKAIKKALVFQNFAIFPWLTVAQNLLFGLEMAGVGQEEKMKKLGEIISEVDLGGSENLHVKELSGGMKQRVGLGRALAIEPELLILDEPFSALDAFTAEELRKLLLNIWLKKHLTVVMVTHLVEEAIELSDRVIVLDNDPKKSSIKKIFENNLARPRNIRTDPFFSNVDRLKESILK
jgi:NitT/TauT family transport system ATP-binding protein